ncbi:unnamed protein product [Penicillium nalgiovense]|nr:unnamed protein product [Penicillium nalgiovense]
MSCFEARLLRLIGTTVTTYDDAASQDPTFSERSPPGQFPRLSSHSSLPSMSATVMEGNSRSWVITEKLSRGAVYMTETDVKMGRGASITVGKFLCHLEGRPDLKAFMRIYHQIPIAGTEDADPDILAQQAVPPETYGELESFKPLKDCPAVPLFLGHAERTQRDQELLPGGYVRYVVWQRSLGSL